MIELHWNLGWTLATLGVCWLALSCVVALALGQIIKRSKARAEPEQSPSLTRQPGQPSAGAEPARELIVTREQPSDDYGNHAASGTRLKPVVLEHEQAESARKVS